MDLSDAVVCYSFFAGEYSCRSSESRVLILSMGKKEINMIHIIVAAEIRFQSILT